MKEAIDIYIKLLIAIISFIAPLLINLLSIFSSGIAVKKKKFDVYENQFKEILKENVNKSQVDISLIGEENKAFEKKKRETRDQLILLDPKQQIRDIFPTFFYSLLLMIINRLGADGEIITFLNIPRGLVTPLLILSFLISIFYAQKGVRILIRVVWAIVDVKQEIAEDEAEEKQQLKAEKVTPLGDNTKQEKH